MASSSQIRNRDAKRIKIEPSQLIDLTSDDEDEIAREWIAAGLRVSNSERERVHAVSGNRERVAAVIEEKKMAPAVDGNRDRVTAVTGEKKRVKRVAAVNGERKRVNDVNGERKRVNAVNGERKRVTAINGVRERVTAVNGERKRVKRVPAMNDDNAGGCQWIANVTRAIENLKVKQTLHIPSWVVQIFLKNRTAIKLRSEANNRMYYCTIKNPGRGEFERYITYGWYDFLSDHKPKVGDLLQFSVKSPTLMVVDIIRRKRRSD